MREYGFYWVKIKPLAVYVGREGTHKVFEGWRPLEWTGRSWWYEDEDYSDDDIEQINEERIKSPDEVKR